MCDFKPGDDIICITTDPASDPYLSERQVYVCRAVVDHGRHPACLTCASVVSLEVVVEGVFPPPGMHFCACAFRKVQRRDLSAWLETATTNTDHLDKPIKTPARPKVDALLQRVQSGEFG